MDKPYETPRSSLLPTLVIFFFILGFLYALFVFFQYMSVNREIATMEGRKEELTLELNSLKGKQVEELFWARDMKEKVTAKSVAWSKIIKSLQDLTPVTVFVSSYSTSEDGSVQLSGVGDSFGAVSDMIRSVEDAKNFADAFASSVTLGTTSDGQPVVSFSLKVNIE